MPERPPKRAAALRYEPDESDAPKLVAKGSGVCAEKIMALAQAHQIPIYEDRDLLELLSALDLETQIPPELYRAVAEVLVFVYQLNQEFSDN